MAINFVDGKYVNPENGRVTLDPTMYADWQIAEEAEKTLPSVDFFRQKLGLLEDEIIPYGKTPKIDFIKVMNRLKDKPDGKFIEVTAVTPTPFGEGKSTVSLGLIEGLGDIIGASDEIIGTIKQAFSDAGNVFLSIGSEIVGKIKQGMVYRGTRMDKAPWLITKKGLDVVLNDLKIRSELDLRHVPKGKPPLKPHGVNITNFGYGSYKQILDRKDQCEATVRFLKKMTDPAYFPVYIHCDGGADRTGIMLFFLESVLGMSEQDLLTEYELTTFFQPRSRNSKQMNPFLETIRKYGKGEDTLANKAVAFLKQYGLTEDNIRKIKNNLFDQTK